MPELPEVELVLRTLRDAPPGLGGRVVAEVTVLSETVITGSCSAGFAAELDGRRFSGFRRHGKYLIFSLERVGEPCDVRYLIVHLRMTGRLYLVPQHNAVQPHTRLLLLLDAGLALRFDDPRKFGRVWLVQNPQPVLAALGPDALSVDATLFQKRLNSCQRQIKPLLLDQSFVAGIGNIYADEILFRARIHPLTRSNLLDEASRLHLYQAVVTVLTEAVAAHGANIDGVFKEGNFVVSVYGRTGQACPVCCAPVVKIRVGQRGTHFCPVCQPLQGNS